MDALKKLGRKVGAAILVLTMTNSAIADTVTYFHNDIFGSPLAATDTAGNLLWKENYKPYGEKLTRSAGSSSNKIGFHGKAHDDGTGLSYMGARYYDPVLGRFTGIDPVDFQEASLHSFNRYTYANNNPYRYVDPDGRWALSAMVRMMAAMFAAMSTSAVITSTNGLKGSGTAGSNGTLFPGSDIDSTTQWNSGRVHNEKQEGTDQKNSNPYSGPVDDAVVVVDSNGNAIPVEPGQRVNSSPNGDYQQVVGANGKPTGDRMDRGGHKTQSDPRAQAPHGHRPGVTTADGNPHLPIY